MLNKTIRTALCLLVWLNIVVQAAPAWKHTIIFPDEPLERREWISGTNMGWIKCTIDLAQETGENLYFQDSQTYDLHYDFVSQHLPPYVDITPQEFDRISLTAENQQLVLGTVITPPQGYPLSHPIHEYGIQLVRRDPYTREETAALFHQIKAAVQADPNVIAYYMPTQEQTALAREHADWFLEQGIPIGSIQQWLKGNVIYSRGWAFGRLNYVSTEDIEDAYINGKLKPTDILLTDAVPAEIPMVAGVISLSASTPNSHVAILANSYAIPFVFLADETDVTQAHALIDHRIVLRATPPISWKTEIRLIDTEGVLTEKQAHELLARKQAPALSISPIRATGSFSLPTDNLWPKDIDRVGGKAANFGLLRRAIPDNSPQAVAFTFDLWQDFMSQILPNGLSLRQQIDQRLNGFTYPPRNMAEVAYVLESIQDLIKDTDQTHFSATAQQAILDTLQDPQYGIDFNRKIRFRSSTNMEDSEHFSGAGLYSSYSGCLLDDLDDDDKGPSHCDPSESKERGVFRAIRKVFASFYNHNAYIERLRHNIHEHDVGMALLVHHSFPDEIERANGVATYENGSYSTSAQLVSQQGAVSVANPEPGIKPEEVSVYIDKNDKVYPRLKAYSNLVPLGQTVLNWPEDYETLTCLLNEVAQDYEKESGRKEYLLDFEYKKIVPDGALIAKQVRPIPQPANNDQWSTLLVSEPIELTTFQGEFADVLANHRLKSEWTLDCNSVWIDANNLAKAFYTDLTLTYQDEGKLHHIEDQMASLPNAKHTVSKLDPRKGYTCTDSWRLADLPNTRTWALRTENIPAQVPVTDCPVVTLQDFSFKLDAIYDHNVPGFDFRLPPCERNTRDRDTITLEARRFPQADDITKTRKIKEKGIEIVTTFTWPPLPTGPTAGYTAPLVEWHQTTITGLTTEPIILTHPFAQTYQPGHHNFWENFLFEPRLDPQVPPHILAELEAKGITQIYTVHGQGQTTICLW